MDTPRRSVDDRRDTFDIRFPLAIAAPVGVTYLNAERNTLAAHFTLSHLLHLLEKISKQRP